MELNKSFNINDIEDRNKIEGIIEGLLFAHGNPLSEEKILKVLNLKKKDFLAIIEEMNDKYKSSNRGIMIRKIKDSYQLCTKPEYYEYLKELAEPKQEPVLSQAAYEILAIIACNKPITRARIEQIRGVNCESAISKLLEYDLIKEAGRLDAPGRPILYETTDKFLKIFGFSSDEEAIAFLDESLE
ncbi:MAG TPA: SMC-Scp complex subunit ScpB [Clostridiaceae bacterium]|nr:SMC-Scp complex subunit ScpB [Clostridiaceae bacterium]